MKKVLIAAALFAVLPWVASAQVEKRVEVTKAYVPSVEDAVKLFVVPDMTDTVTMRPDIDYSITPLSLQTTLTTLPIRPATVTYWEFNRPLPFYLKAGAGYPLNSVLDFYASTQNPGTGYVVGYVNHDGRYAKIHNDFGNKKNAVRMTNRVGVAAGKYFGRRVFEGDLSYENRLYHRYGTIGVFTQPPSALPQEGGDASTMLDYSDAKMSFRFGDDFQDLSRVNFEIALRGGLFYDHSDAVDYTDKALQATLETHGKIARAFGRHRLSAEVGYERLTVQKPIDNYLQHLIHAALRYGVEGGVVRFEAGADYYHDKINGVAAENYLLPFLQLDFNLGTPGLKPFIEIDGRVQPNSYRSLTQQNPYVLNPTTLDKSSVDYNGRFGLCGSLWRDKFTYRLYAGFSIRDNRVYWTNHVGLRVSHEPIGPGNFKPVQARQTLTSFNGEVEYRPVSNLHMTLGAHGYIYNDDTELGNGSPAFEGNLGVRYQGRKIAFGVQALMQTKRTWTTPYLEPMEHGFTEFNTFEAPTAVDLRVNFDWKVSGGVTLFVEGRNLANCDLYEFPWYPEYGANFTVGVKANF